MKKISQIPMRGVLAVLTAGLTLGGMLATTSRADYYQWPASIPVENEATNGARGVQAAPILNAPVVTATNVTVSWYGMQGWSTVEASTNLTDWTPAGGVKATAHNWSSKLTNAFGAGASFRVAQTNFYAGSGECAGCHGDTYDQYANTAHAGALASLQNIGMGNNPQCLQCHNVGMNQPTGFTGGTTTPHLANVGCESCHGPAGWHKNSDHNIHPVVSIDPKICGSCHQDSHHPTYEEYAESAHGGAAFETRTSCGPCHSATLRMAMLNEYNDRLAGYPHTMSWPDTATISAWTATCATCHDPHSSSLTNQLRNPMYSTNFYTMPSLEDGVNNTTFDTFYNPNIQICGQCHNNRGARWDNQVYAVIVTNMVSGPVTNVAYVDLYTTNTVTQVFTNELGVPYLTNSYTYSYVSGRTNTTVVTLLTNSVRYAGLTNNLAGSAYGRPPHHSPQYNVLIGNVQEGYLPVRTHNHTRIANQCTACHMASYAVNSNTNVTGHTFEMDVKGCALAGCHTSYSEEALHLKIEDLALQESNSIAGVVSLLNQWAVAKGTNTIGATAYNRSKQNTWEFSTIGGLATITNSGPVGTNQMKLPEAIRKARYNLYMVYHDGSMGTHNPDYTKLLLADAQTNVLSQLTDVPAIFSANTVLGYAPMTVQFTNLNGSATGGDWTFGDGGTATGLNPAYVYNTPGTYSVTFTESAGSTITRTAYIRVREKPVMSFTADTVTGPAPFTVTFTNTSTATSDVDWWRWQFNLASSSTRLDTPATSATYTYTNPGTYSVLLRANMSGGGNLSITNVSYITVTAP